MNATPHDHDAWTDEVIARINRSGEAMFGASWNDRRAMRISVVNWRTSQSDVDRQSKRLGVRWLELSLLVRSDETHAVAARRRQPLEQGRDWLEPRPGAGHLNDLEPLWLQRAGDIVEGKADLTVADLSNRKTHQSDHDQLPLVEHINRFERNRTTFVSRIRAASAEDLARVSKHPRLSTLMRSIDLAFFVAEHDDHHLAKLRELKGHRGTHSSEL
jgi:hypothetical protein